MTEDEFLAILNQVESKEAVLSNVKEDLYFGNKYADAVVRATRDAPSTLYNMPSAIGGLVSDVYDTVKIPAIMFGKAMTGSPITSSDYGDFDFDLETAGRAARGVGTIAAGTAGGLVGAAATPFVGGVGAIPGSAAGVQAFNKLLELVGVDEPRTLEETLVDTVYDTTQGGLFAGASKVGAKTVGGGVNKLTGKSKLLEQQRVIKELADNANTLPQKVALPTDDLSLLKSASELTGDAGLMRAEANLTRLIPEVMADSVDATRGATRLGFIEDVISSADDVERGSVIRNVVGANKQATKAGLKSQYEGLSQVKDIKPVTLADDILSIMDEFDSTITKDSPAALKTASKVSPEITSFRDQLFDLSESNVSVDDLRLLSKHAKDIARDAKGVDQIVAGRLASAIDKQINSVPEGAAAFKANKEYREFKGLFDEGLGKKITGKNKFGRDLTEESKIPSKTRATPEAATQFKKLVKNNPSAQSAFDDSALEVFKSKLGNKADPAGGKAAVKWFETQGRTLQEGLSPESYKLMKGITDDIKSANAKFEASRQGSQGVSPTAALKNYDEYLKKKVGGRLADALTSGTGKGAALGLAATIGGAMGFSTNFITSMGTAWIGSQMAKSVVNAVEKSGISKRRAIYQALTNPEKYNQVMKTKGVNIPSPTGTQAVIGAKLGQEQAKEQSKTPPQMTISEDEFMRILTKLDKEQVANEVQNQKATKQDTVPKDIKAPEAAKVDVSLNTSINSFGGLNSDLLLDAIRDVESGGGKFLVSKVGAKGPYQFMPATARRIGLDDPMDEVKARAAALKLLQSDKDFTGTKDPRYAILAYNVGGPRVKRALKKVGDESKFNEVLAEALKTISDPQRRKEAAAYVTKVLTAYEKRMGLTKI